MWSKHLSRWICGDGIDGKKYTIDKADSDKGDFKGIQSFQENSRKAVSCSRILQWISNLKRPRIKHQGARIIARCPATYICVSFPDRSSAAGPHNQSIIIKARSKHQSKIKARIQNRFGSLAFDNSLAICCTVHDMWRIQKYVWNAVDWNLPWDFSGVSLRKNSTHFMPDFVDFCRISAKCSNLPCPSPRASPKLCAVLREGCPPSVRSLRRGA